MSRSERLLLLLLVAFRVGNAAVRLAADPRRFWNVEESYNATLGWYLVHGDLWSELPLLQYRSFCGGCSVVAMAAAPLVATFDSFAAWKLVPLLWTAATMLAGFFPWKRGSVAPPRGPSWSRWRCPPSASATLRRWRGGTTRRQR